MKVEIAGHEPRDHDAEPHEFFDRGRNPFRHRAAVDDAPDACKKQHQEAEEIDDRVETGNQHLRAEISCMRQGTAADLAAHDRAEQVVARVSRRRSTNGVR